MRPKKYWQFVLYLIGSLLIRFWNFQNAIYFIYDQGRDAWVLEKIAHGHPVLVGPTSGLSGFFLGPLWYYLGLPGYILSRGNPYGICLWYTAISCLAIPLYWYLSHKLFKSQAWAILLAVLLAILPGSLTASLMIWNPLMSVPLMLSALLSLWQVRVAASHNRAWLAIGFLCLAFTLQSEFAYGIFFLIPWFLAIPWLRQNFNWRDKHFSASSLVKDYAVVIFMIGLTLLPQLGFELRNHFIMTKSLLKSTASSSTSVSWQVQFSQRPEQLLAATQQVIFGANERTPYLLPILLILALAGAFFAWRDKNLVNSFLWKLISIFAVLPYPFYLLWRGNNGFFFWYYLTCHYIFLVPLIILGAYKLVQISTRKNWQFILAAAFVVFIMTSLGATSWQNWYDTSFHAAGNANLAKMVEAVSTINQWHAEDGNQPFIVRTYTANVLTEQYDYLFYWYANSHHLAIPSTVRGTDDQTWYILIEQSDHSQKSLFDSWYAEATAQGHLVKQQQIGIFRLEKWQK